MNTFCKYLHGCALPLPIAGRATAAATNTSCDRKWWGMWEGLDEHSGKGGGSGKIPAGLPVSAHPPRRAAKKKKKPRERTIQTKKKRRSPSTLRITPYWIPLKVECQQGVSAPFFTLTTSNAKKIFEYIWRERNLNEYFDITVNFLFSLWHFSMRKTCQHSCRHLMTLLLSRK